MGEHSHDHQCGYDGAHHPVRVPGAPALLAEDLVVRFRSNGRAALDGVSLSVQPGESVALVGANGAGKSTLLRAAAALVTPSSGSLRIFGHSPGSCHHRVAFLAQSGGGIDWRFPLQVRDLVLTGRYVHLGWFRRPTRDDRRIADAAIDDMDLAPLARRPLAQLSGGEQQRVLLARAIAQRASLFLLDEPFASLDADSRARLLAALARVREAGGTLVVSTHEQHPPGTFSRTVRLDAGRVVGEPRLVAAAGSA